MAGSFFLYGSFRNGLGKGLCIHELQDDSQYQQANYEHQRFGHPQNARGRASKSNMKLAEEIF